MYSIHTIERRENHPFYFIQKLEANIHSRMSRDKNFYPLLKDFPGGGGTNNGIKFAPANFFIWKFLSLSRQWSWCPDDALFDIKCGVP